MKEKGRERKWEREEKRRAGVFIRIVYRLYFAIQNFLDSRAAPKSFYPLSELVPLPRAVRTSGQKEAAQEKEGLSRIMIWWRSPSVWGMTWQLPWHSAVQQEDGAACSHLRSGSWVSRMADSAGFLLSSFSYTVWDVGQLDHLHSG